MGHKKTRRPGLPMRKCEWCGKFAQGLPWRIDGYYHKKCGDNMATLRKLPVVITLLDSSIRDKYDDFIATFF